MFVLSGLKYNVGLEEGRRMSNPLMGRRAKIEETSSNQISEMNYAGNLEN